MPILKKEEIMSERPIIMVIYGTPGVGKTSFAITSNKPLLIDTDRGYDRACFRVDTLTATCWEDIYNTEILGKTVVKNGQQVFQQGIIRDYDTIIVDTAKSLLDDYLSTWCIMNDYKLATNSLKRYGLMGDKFKEFTNMLRSYGKDLIFVCHDKETLEGDIVKHSPDCTGQSKDLLIRIADQVGFICKENGNRVVHFEPIDTRVGKNVGRIEDYVIPDCGSDEFSYAMSEIVNQVKVSISNRDGVQKESLQRLKEAKQKLLKVSTAEDANALIDIANSLSLLHQRGFKQQMMTVLKEKNIDFDKTKNKFVNV